MANDPRRFGNGWLSLGLLATLLMVTPPAFGSEPDSAPSERLEALARSLVTVLRQEQRALARRAAELDALERQRVDQAEESIASQSQLDRLAELRARLDGATSYALAAERISVLASNLDQLAAPAIDGRTVEVGLAAAELVAATELREAPDDSAAVIAMADAGTVLIVIGTPSDARWRLVATQQHFGFILTDALAEL